MLSYWLIQHVNQIKCNIQHILPFFMVSGKVSCYGKLWTPPRKRLNVSYFYLSGRPGDNMTLPFKDTLN